jgi:hypothetical protein
VDEFRIVVVRGGDRPTDVVRPTTARDLVGAEMERPGLEALIVINGVTELDRWGGLGRDPDALLNPDMPLLPPADGSPVSRALQCCGCGDVGCGSVTFTIRLDGDVIEWVDARDGDRRLPDIGPFRFDAANYEAEVRRAHRERGWETREERIARLVTEACWAERRGRPRSFDWAAGSTGAVTVCVTEWHPNPVGGQESERFSDGQGGWYTTFEPDELFVSHLGEFPVSDDTDDAAVAAGIVERIHSVDPASWKRPQGWTYGP